MSCILVTRSEAETVDAGRALARTLVPGSVVLLSGDLGAGKTAFIRGMAAGLGIDPLEVSSPTFTLIHEYGAQPAVYHVDLYRLDYAREAARLGLEEIFEKEAVVLIEWGEKFPELLPDERVEIRITSSHDNQREITVDRIHI